MNRTEHTLRPFLVAFLGSLVAWAVFLSYDTHSYAVWQIVGAALVVVVAGVVSVRAGNGGVVPTVLGLTSGMVVPWTLMAAREDVTGLYAVGALLLTAGMLISSSLIAVTADRLLRRGSRPGTGRTSR